MGNASTTCDDDKWRVVEECTECVTMTDSIEFIKTNDGLLVEHGLATGSTETPKTTYVLVDWSTMGGQGPIQAALLSSGAFEGKNPGEEKWIEIISTRIFKTYMDGKYTHFEVGDMDDTHFEVGDRDDRCLISVEAELTEPSTDKPADDMDKSVTREF